MKTLLSGNTVENTNKVLDEIIADESMPKEKRRRLVAQVMMYQPLPTIEFAAYDKWNADYGMRVDSSVERHFRSGVIFGLLSAASFLLAAFLPLPEAIEIAACFLFLFISGMSFLAVGFEAFYIMFKMRFGIRRYFSLSKYEENQERKRQELENMKVRKLPGE